MTTPNPSATPQPNLCNGPYGEEEQCPVHGAEIRAARYGAKSNLSTKAIERCIPLVRLAAGKESHPWYALAGQADAELAALKAAAKDKPRYFTEDDL